MEPAVVFWTEIRARHVPFFSPIFNSISVQFSVQFQSNFQFNFSPIFSPISVQKSVQKTVQTLWDSCSPIFQHTKRQQELRRISFFLLQQSLFKYYKIVQI
jgi:hypothetical protein